MIGNDSIHLAGIEFIDAGQPPQFTMQIITFDEIIGFNDFSSLLRITGIFDANGAGGNFNNWSRESDERLLRNRQLKGGVKIDLAATDLDTDRTRFTERGLPDPSNLGTIVVVNGAGEQGQIQMNRLGRLTVQ